MATTATAPLPPPPPPPPPATTATMMREMNWKMIKHRKRRQKKVVLCTDPKSKPVFRYRYFSTWRTGISVWGRYVIQEFKLPNYGTKFRGTKPQKNTFEEHQTEWKKKQINGFAMFKGSPYSRQKWKTSTHRVQKCVSAAECESVRWHWKLELANFLCTHPVVFTEILYYSRL